MSFADLHQNIRAKMVAEWDLDDAVVAWQNVDFTPPNADSWLRFAVNTGPSETKGIDGSTGLVRDHGTIAIQVFVPEGSGDLTESVLVDKIIPIYEHTGFDGIVCYTATVTNMGANNGWHQTNVTIPFRRVRNVGS